MRAVGGLYCLSAAIAYPTCFSQMQWQAVTLLARRGSSPQEARLR